MRPRAAAAGLLAALVVRIAAAGGALQCKTAAGTGDGGTTCTGDWCLRTSTQAQPDGPMEHRWHCAGAECDREPASSSPRGDECWVEQRVAGGDWRPPSVADVVDERLPTRYVCCCKSAGMCSPDTTAVDHYGALGKVVLVQADPGGDDSVLIEQLGGERSVGREATTDGGLR